MAVRHFFPDATLQVSILSLTLKTIGLLVFILYSFLTYSVIIK